jgi:hypothetical protein
MERTLTSEIENTYTIISYAREALVEVEKEGSAGR